MSKKKKSEKEKMKEAIEELQKCVKNLCEVIDMLTEGIKRVGKLQEIVGTLMDNDEHFANIIENVQKQLDVLSGIIELKGEIVEIPKDKKKTKAKTKVTYIA